MLKIDTRKKLGAIKPVNGICNGPVSFGGLIDCSQFFKQAGFPYCRFHDTNYPNAGEVDIHTIFKDFNADENDSENYDFRKTDIYIEEAEATGAKIVFRLGESIEHTKTKFYVHPPADFDKWAKICLNIARHYNEGWANGFHKNIMYWEVWNEPDHEAQQRELDAMWSGTQQQYFDLYATTVRLFKKEMPNVKIGGYVAADVVSPWKQPYLNAFLDFVKKNELPLDFFSWHIYASKVEKVRHAAAHARRKLDEYGFADTEMTLTEWNFIMNRPFWGVINDLENPASAAKARHEIMPETEGLVGASFTAAVLIEMADLPIDIATFYDGQPTNFFCTIFDRWGYPTKQYYPFVAFDMAVKQGERVYSECEISGTYALATASESGVSIMLSNWEGRTGEYPVEIVGFDPNKRCKYEIFTLDARHDFEKTTELSNISVDDFPKDVYMHANDVVLIKITEE